MIKSSYQLFTIFGIPIKADLSLLVLAFLWISTEQDPLYGLAAGVVLLASIVLHELGHSLIAMAFGCRVRDITLMMLGGCASLLSMPKKAWQEFLMAIAGPLVSLLLAMIGFACSGAQVDQGQILMPRGILHEFAFYRVGLLNLMLFLFNMLPAFPMDGGRILRAFLQQFFMSRLKATWIASRIGRFVAILMALSVLFSFFSGKFAGYSLIRLLIAYWIYRAADQEYRMVLMEEGDVRRHPFEGFPFFRSATDVPPPDEGKAVVSPPPYAKWSGPTRVDVRKEEER